jgi:hypothetical protein
VSLVRIVKNWEQPNLMRQTPGESGIWDGIQFTEEPVERSDYVIVLNMPVGTIRVDTPPEHIWAIMQEPPNEYYAPMHLGQSSYHRIFTTDPSLTGPRFVQSQPALPWHVNKNYDDLLQSGVPDKEGRLSWITSNLNVHAGHKVRMNFLKKIQGQVQFDLFGRGFREIRDKWDGLAPYQYSIVVENFSNPFYWSEKLADSFLSWTMPIYYGCTRITEYFPAESMICIDVDDPDVIEKINEVTASQRWQQNLDAIAEARQLVLNRYQFFPFVAEQIRAEEQNAGSLNSRQHQSITIVGEQRPQLNWRGRLRRRAKTMLNRIREAIAD